jgi:hypothetical protein
VSPEEDHLLDDFAHALIAVTPSEGHITLELFWLVLNETPPGGRGGA